MIRFQVLVLFPGQFHRGIPISLDATGLGGDLHQSSSVDALTILWLMLGSTATPMNKRIKSSVVYFCVILLFINYILLLKVYWRFLGRKSKSNQVIVSPPKVLYNVLFLGFHMVQPSNFS